MKISFLGQGFEAESKKSVGNQIVKFFQHNKFNSFTGISAFASEAGISGLAECINSGKEHYNKYCCPIKKASKIEAFSV